MRSKTRSRSQIFGTKVASIIQHENVCNRLARLVTFLLRYSYHLFDGIKNPPNPALTRAGWTYAGRLTAHGYSYFRKESDGRLKPAPRRILFGTLAEQIVDKINKINVA